jgi:hypothetical protein
VFIILIVREAVEDVRKFVVVRDEKIIVIVIFGLVVVGSDGLFIVGILLLEILINFIGDALAT